MTASVAIHNQDDSAVTAGLALLSQQSGLLEQGIPS